jgi:hypothetical protein
MCIPRNKHRHSAARVAYRIDGEGRGALVLFRKHPLEHYQRVVERS